MVVLELILVFILQFEVGTSVKHSYLYYTPGHEAVLSCKSPSDTSCSMINWLYNGVTSQTENEVENGKVVTSSVRVGRLSLNTDCSLVINNITAEDAGLYTCRLGSQPADSDVAVYLSVLTISPSPPDVDPNRDDEVTLECSLSRHSHLLPCKQDSIRWVDETGTVLRGEGVGYESIRQMSCVSVLTVKHQRGHNRRYTCQFVDEDHVKIEAEYPPAFKHDYIYITVGAGVGVVVLLLLLLVITVVLIKYRKRTKETENLQKPVKLHDEPENNLTYITVSYDNQKASQKKQAKEEEKVTYSTIMTVMKTETENDPSHVYSCVSK